MLYEVITYGLGTVDSWRLDEPVDLVVAPTGMTYVVDAGRRDVVEYGPSYNFV